MTLPSRPTVAVIGAGVIGQIYAGRLADAGNDVWLLARGSTYALLRAEGVRLREEGLDSRPPVRVVESVDEIPTVDLVFLAVRTDQVAEALPVVAAVTASIVVTLVNLTDNARAVSDQIGRDRVVLGFPGVGGMRTGDGIEYRRIRQQPTALGVAGGRENTVAEALRAAGLDVDLVADLESWLATHTVFIAGVGAAILSAGSAEALGADRAATTRMILSIRDGFNSLTRHGTLVTPVPLRAIFTRSSPPPPVDLLRTRCA